MTLSKRDKANSVQLRLLISMVADIKALVVAKKPLPENSLKVVPEWCRNNPGRAAKTITLLRDALMRAIGHCDRAKHKDSKYRGERDAIVDALRGPR